MMKFKKVLSTLLAVCLLVSVLPATSLAAVDTSTLSNYFAPEGYHLFENLPTAENPKTTATLYLGSVLEEGGDFYAISGLYADAASTDKSTHCTVTVEYGGTDATNGNYYYLTVRLADGSKLWTFAYGSSFTNNTVDASTGKPVSGGAWATKHRLYYDATGHFFYNASGNTFALNASTFKLGTVGVNVFGTSMPVRLFEKCSSDGVPGSNATHQWSGSCSCGLKYDYQEKPNVEITDPAGYHLFTKLPTAENAVTNAQLYLGAAFEENGALYAMSVKANDSTTSTDETGMRPITVHYDADNACYYLVYVGTDGAEYAVACASNIFQQNKIQDTGTPSGGWASKHRLYFDEEGQFFYHSSGNALAINADFELVTAAVNALGDSMEPVRLFEKCTSNNIPGENETHTWTGTCSCGEKFGYKCKVTNPAGYHLFTDLPTVENPKTTANLYLGTDFENGGDFYAISGLYAAAASTNKSTHCTVTVQYGGTDATNGDYYYLMVRLADGSKTWTFAYGGSSFTNNTVFEDTGTPSGGWASKHRLYYHEEGQFFYNIAGNTFAFDASTFKLSTVSVAAVLSGENVTARLFETCVSNNVPGESNTHTWSGACACGYKFDYKCKVTDPVGYHLFTALPTAENGVTSAQLYLGAAFEENGTLYAMSEKANSTKTSTDETSMRPITVHYDADNACYYLVYLGTDGTTEYAVCCANSTFSQNMLTDGLPSGGWASKHRLYFEEEGQFFYHSTGYALSIDASTFALSTAAVADVLNGSKTAARVFEKCTSNNVPGENDTHTWSGVCSCGYKFDYKCKIADPADYHLFKDLPSAENAVTSAQLYLGAAFEENGTLYAMSEKANSSATSADVESMRPITVRYDADNACYYLVYLGTDGTTEYAVCCANSTFSQNKLTDGLPSGGWASKHRLYFDEDGQFFYHSSGYALAINADFELVTATVADVLSGSKTAARVFEKCTSDNVPGTDKNGMWDGVCQECRAKFGYREYVNGNNPYNYHLVTDLPAEAEAEMTGLVMGAALSDYSLLYGVSGTSASSIFPTAKNAVMSTITLRNAGDNTYNIIFTSGTDSYALSCSTGLIAQNKIQDTGTPSGGWDSVKHAFYFDAEYRFFYNINQKGAIQGLVLNTETFKVETKAVEEMKTDSTAYLPVRIYQACTSDGVAGKDEIYHWSGICTSCGDKVDHRKQRMDVLVPTGYHLFGNLPTADNAATNTELYLGAVIAGKGEFYSQSGLVSGATTTALAYDMCGYTIRYDAENVCYYLVFKNTDGKEYAVTFDAKNLAFTQNMIIDGDAPTNGWQEKHQLQYNAEGQFFYNSSGYALAIDTSALTLTTALVEDLLVGCGTPVRLFEKCIPAEDTAGENETHHWSGLCAVCGSKTDYECNYVAQLNAPAENTPYFWGFTQKDKEGEPVYHFNRAIAGNNLDTVENNMLGSTPIYVQTVEGGYVLYFENKEGTRQYIWYGTTETNTSKHFAFVDGDTAATVFGWSQEHKGFTVTVDGTELILGAYSSTKADGSVNTAYSKITGLGVNRFDQETNKDHTFVAQLYVKHMSHTFGTWTMDLDGSGILYRTCECGRVQAIKASDKMPAYAGVSLSLNNSFAINFYVESASFASEAYTNPYVVFEMLGQKTTVTEPAVKGSDYVFTFINLAPDLMGETVTATLYATAADGSEFALTSEYSIAEYCYTTLAMDSISNELKVLLVETLNFGAASQIYRNSEEPLVNANLTDEQKALGYADGWRTFETCRGFVADKEKKDVNWYGATLLMSDSVKLRVYFSTSDATGLSVKAVGETIGEHTLTDIGTKDGRYYVDFAQLNPAQMSEAITFTVCRGEDAVSTSLTYSVESYARAWMDKEAVASPAQIGLVKAVIKYGDAAKAYAALQGHTVNDTETLASGVTKYEITYHASGLQTKAYAVVVDADSSAQVMTVAAPWDETNNDSNPVTLYTAYQYRTQLKNKDKNVLAITNGGFFKKAAGSNLPWGMQIIDGEVLQEPSTASPAYSDNWFGVTKDGDYVISDTAGYNSTYKDKDLITYGIGGGKLLIKNGEAQSVSGEDSYRTCVAITANGDLVLICLEECSYAMTIFALQELENVLGVAITTALNMDGGGSTTMYTTGKWSLSYDICGDGWSPRSVADAIAIVAE